MGVQITELLKKKEISIKDLSGKVIAVDSHLFLYQFLSTIRQPDGSLLMDSKGNVTSHLSGLFNRSIRLMQNGLKLIYVFDGKPPELKEKERQRRKQIKIEAEKKFEEAKAREDIDGMKKFAARTSRLTSDMIQEAKKLIDALGLPIVEAPSEGEAQAAYIVSKGDAFAVASQDADSLLFGSPKLIRNLSLLGKRKKANKLSYETLQPEIIDLSDNLNNLGIDRTQLIALAMLVGTDYNEGGIKGIGPKNALKLVKENKTNFETLFKKVKWDDFYAFPWTEVFDTIKKMPVDDHYNLEWKSIDKDKILKIMVEEHDFSEERILSSIDRFKKEKKDQKGLSDFF